MKQPFFAQALIDVFSKLNKNHFYFLDKFHPDFFLSLCIVLDTPVFLVFPDIVFNTVLKYLSGLIEDDGVVFVPPVGGGGGSPAGFLSQSSYHVRRAQELLSSGVGSVSFIACSDSGVARPLVGPGDAGSLVFSGGISFDECLAYLSTYKYNSVEIVLVPGDFCVRGGLIDIYPFSSSAPVRIIFLDDNVEVHRFDVQTQLTVGRVDNFSLSSPEKKSLLALKDVPLSNFISLYYSPNESAYKDIASPVGFSKCLSSIDFEEFSGRIKVVGENVFIDKNLTSVGVVDNFKNYTVPPWFVNRRPEVVLPVEIPTFNIPLDINTIKKGDYLVHRDHGVGVYAGLQINAEVDEIIQEFLLIKYDDGGVIRLNTGRLDLIDYFASADSENVVLDSLQKKGSWTRKLNSARRRAEEITQSLLDLYVRRNDLSRTPLIAHEDMELEFFNGFPYKDTPDQATAWNEISKDLSSCSPMDRLLCGDVGFGKTEIALRTSFRVILENRRVIVLAPTTILSNQLYASFLARMGPHAVNVDLVSRFCSANKIKQILEKISLKENDVLVGTHSLLNNDKYLKNMGLLIIDEEHRFGVKQKEKIKSFKEGVDVLSMSATPIPRSLNLALSGIYSISLLQTPPLMRRAIITRVIYFDDQIIQDAILYEIDRGGQVYFVHNNIQSIAHITGRLQELLPNLCILFIHGQESPLSIEQKMRSFTSGGIQVLVCTSIIEAGIDVPNANCIIINNSHLFGLSQLYQIRGRVGRAHRQAYAYLIIPNGFSLSDKAYSRIKTIEENTQLGAGYNIARSDMELRGSGSLFGFKQSGGSSSVGYEMYLRLIQRALFRSGQLSSGFLVLPEDVVIDALNPRYIPENYISSEGLRLSFYKSLASAADGVAIDSIVYNMKNRFGPVPLPAHNLVLESRLRLLAASAGVFSIQHRGCGLVCKIKHGDFSEFSKAIINFVEEYFFNIGVTFHFFPTSGESLSLCIHEVQAKDIYSLLLGFLNKFKGLN